MRIGLIRNHHLLIGAIEGLRSKGVEVVHSSNKNIMFWGWREAKTYNQKGHNVLIFERGYLGDRFKYTSIAWNGLNGHGDFCNPKPDKKRFDKVAELKPWAKEGDYILIMGQVAGDQSLQGVNLTNYYEQWAEIAQKHYNKPVYFRPHPHAHRLNFNPKIEKIDGDLISNLKNAYLVITYNSNTSVDSVINGVPCVTMGLGSMAHDVTSHDITQRIMPKREDWAYKLASCQWSEKELLNGDFVDRMLCRLES